MKTFSTSQAARKLDIGIKTLSRYIAEKKVPPPKIIDVGGRVIHIWTSEEIENIRKLLPKIANGRKTRYKEKGKTQPKKKSKP